MPNELVLVNVRSKAGKPRLEIRNGREVLVVPSATMPDDIVMNGNKGSVFYPADEIAKSYAQLDRTPAPVGHPIINGQYVSAKDEEARNIFGIGAFNANVRRQNGRVLLDKIIDVEWAKASKKGRDVLGAIDAGNPIHTSTGVLAKLEAAPSGSGYQYIARDMHFDHDAILINEEGAAKPEQGVGMMVNNEKIEVVNCAISDADELDWASQHAARIMQEKSPEWKSLVERVRSAIVEAFSSSAVTNALRGSKKETTMDGENTELKELTQKVNGLEEKLNGIGDVVANAVKAAVKPIQDNLDAVKANQDAKDAAELTELTNKIVKANLMTEEGVKGLTLNAARELAEKAKPGTAAAINGAFHGPDGKPSFVLPKGDN